MKKRYHRKRKLQKNLGDALVVPMVTNVGKYMSKEEKSWKSNRC
jgi:hypothetical protein